MVSLVTITTGFWTATILKFVVGLQTIETTATLQKYVLSSLDVLNLVTRS